MPLELFSAHILPPWASIIFLTIKRPRPVPWSDLVANFVNSLGKISLSMPIPLSFIITITLLLLLPLS